MTKGRELLPLRSTRKHANCLFKFFSCKMDSKCQDNLVLREKNYTGIKCKVSEHLISKHLKVHPGALA